jgi:hypothetical protein
VWYCSFPVTRVLPARTFTAVADLVGLVAGLVTTKEYRQLTYAKTTKKDSQNARGCRWLSDSLKGCLDWAQFFVFR